VTGGSVAESHAGSLDVVADQLAVVAGQLPDALGDRPLGAFTQFLVAGLRDAMGETTSAVTCAVAASDRLSAALRAGTEQTGSWPAADLLAELTATAGAVRAGTWCSVVDDPVASAGRSPLSGMAAAGAGWLTPFVSFLEEPLARLRGNPGPVTAGAQEFERAAQDVAAVAAAYRRATADAHGGFADGLAALAEGSATVASALTGARDVVDRVIRVVTGIVAEAVAMIAPIMAAAVARVAVTFGESVAAAIPRCVEIATAAGRRIGDRLAALWASGQRLLELVGVAMAVTLAVRRVFEEIGVRESG